MEIKKICSECGREFTANHFMEKYCSEECREKRTKKLKKLWKENHPNYEREHRQKRIIESAISRCSKHFGGCSQCPYRKCRFE